jgi:hypothetical protein
MAGRSRGAWGSVARDGMDTPVRCVHACWQAVRLLRSACCCVLAMGDLPHSSFTPLLVKKRLQQRTSRGCFGVRGERCRATRGEKGFSQLMW